MSHQGDGLPHCSRKHCEARGVEGDKLAGELGLRLCNRVSDYRNVVIPILGKVRKIIFDRYGLVGSCVRHFGTPVWRQLGSRKVSKPPNLVKTLPTMVVTIAYQVRTGSKIWDEHYCTWQTYPRHRRYWWESIFVEQYQRAKETATRFGLYYGIQTPMTGQGKVDARLSPLLNLDLGQPQVLVESNCYRAS
jgi:hypothetical protein